MVMSLLTRHGPYVLPHVAHTYPVFLLHFSPYSLFWLESDWHGAPTPQSYGMTDGEELTAILD